MTDTLSLVLLFKIFLGYPLGFFGNLLSIVLAGVVLYVIFPWLVAIVVLPIKFIFCKLTGISFDEEMPVMELYSRITDKTFFEETYEGPLLSLVLWLVGLSGVAVWVLLITREATMDSVLLTLACVFVFVPAYVFAFFLFRHFYSRFLHKRGRWAKWHLTFMIALIVASWTAAVWMMVARTPAYKMNQFNKVIEACEQSEAVEKEFFAGFRVGMTADEFNALADSLCQQGLARWDTSSLDKSVQLQYLGYNSSKDYHYCILRVFCSFYKGDEYLYHVGLHSMVGSDIAAFKADVLERLGKEGWRHLDLPEPYYDDGFRLPKYQVRMGFDTENLYNDDDNIYVKDNMLVVVRPYNVDFYDMPTFALRPYWSSRYF